MITNSVGLHTVHHPCSIYRRGLVHQLFLDTTMHRTLVQEQSTVVGEAKEKYSKGPPTVIALQAASIKQGRVHELTVAFFRDGGDPTNKGPYRL